MLDAADKTWLVLMMHNLPLLGVLCSDIFRQQEADKTNLKRDVLKTETFRATTRSVRRHCDYHRQKKKKKKLLSVPPLCCQNHFLYAPLCYRGVASCHRVI